MGSVMTLRDAQAIAGKPRQVTMYFIELKDPDKVDSVKAWLEENIPEISVSVTSEFTENMPDMKTSRASIGALAVLMALVGSVGMTNTILMSVLERTRELGVLRAVGWSRSRILLMILKESLLLSGLSGLAGIGIGIGLSKILLLVPGIGGFMSADFQPKLLAQALAVAFTLGALGGLYPAWRATKMRPIEALRYE
jgi:putative ABC transport system permease protein